MANEIFVVAEHLGGEVTELSLELIAMGRSLAATSGAPVVAALIGAPPAAAATLGGADRVLVVGDPHLDEFNPEAHAAVAVALVKEREPTIVLVPYTSIGMDLASAISVGCELPLVSYCRRVTAAGGLGATCQLHAGKVEADVTVQGDRAVFAVLSGSTSADDGRVGGAHVVEEIASPVDLTGGKITFVQFHEPAGGDVDITAADVLVVVGRGIDSGDNIELADELAAALGGAVAASRPIIDQGWLPKSRQVGKSGLTVKPKAYLAFGVSGAPEHVEGMRSSSTIVAVNSDPQAPIFGVAHYGWVGDLFDILPELTDRLEG